MPADGPRFTNRWWLAAAASFGVYLVPLVGPHAIFLLGGTLYGGLTRHNGGKSTGWVASQIGVALLLQAAAALVIAWSLRGRRIRLVVPVLLAPVLAGFVNYVYMGALPAHFLIERDDTPETSSLPEQCVVAGAGMIDVRAPVSALRPATVAWAQRSDGRFVLVRPAACAAVEVNLPVPTVQPGGHLDFMLGPVFATADGATLFERTEGGPGTRSWWLFSADRQRFERLDLPPAQQATPVLSDDGDAVAWIETVGHEERPASARLHLRSIEPSAPDHPVDLAPLGAATYVVAAYDRAGGAIWLWRDDRFVVINPDGHLLRQTEPASTIRPQLQTWVMTAGGALQWDAYRDDEPYWLAWKTSEGAGRSRVPLGRSITSAALETAGRFVAVSTTTSVSVGSVRDAVYVFSARDGSEIFRRYSPTYTRSSVRFFDGGLFAYSDLAGTHVLRLPRS